MSAVGQVRAKNSVTRCLLMAGLVSFEAIQRSKSYHLADIDKLFAMSNEHSHRDLSFILHILSSIPVHGAGGSFSKKQDTSVKVPP